VAINTNITDLQEFLTHIVANTNMSCLTPLADFNMVCVYTFDYSILAGGIIVIIADVVS
jgi:hypothetical protein